MWNPSRGSWFTALLTLVIALGVWGARSLPSAARVFPLTVGLGALALCAVQLASDVRGRTVAPARILDVGDDSGLPAEVVTRRAWRYFAWFCGFLLLAVAVGFHVAFAAFVGAYLRIEARASMLRTLVIASTAVLVVYGLVQHVLELPLPRGLVRQYW